MRKSIVTLAAVLTFLPATAVLPASAQTQGKTYAFGRADFCSGYVEDRRAERLWLTSPYMYEFIYRSAYLPRPVVIDCDGRGARHDLRLLR
jgi:hypothetical protein